MDTYFSARQEQHGTHPADCRHWRIKSRLCGLMADYIGRIFANLPGFTQFMSRRA